MVVWLQLSYRQALQVCGLQIKNLIYVMYRYFLAHAEKRVVGWNGWCNGLGKVRQCKGYTNLKSCALLLRQHCWIPQNGCCVGSKRSQGWVRWDLMVWLWSDMIRNGKGAVGWDRCIIPNKVEYPKRTQLGCPLILCSPHGRKIIPHFIHLNNVK